MQTAGDQDQTAGERVPLALVLAAVEQELDGLGRMAERLQHTIAPLAGQLPDNATLEELQDLDLLAQSLQGLSEFMAKLAAPMPAEWQAAPGEAARGLRLAALSRRLAGGLAAGTEEPESGDCELFG